MVEAVSITMLSQPMFNLTVDTAHTFFVGDGEWLVHNETCSWPPNMPVTPEGESLADLADDAHEQAFFTHTSAVTKVDGKIYVTTNGGASKKIRADIKRWAEHHGYTYLDNDVKMTTLPGILTNDHAEQFLYYYFSDKGGVNIIGVSGAPCTGACQTFFTPELGVQIVYNRK
ncbi:MAG: hypothetical protein F9K27_14580 [Anaerolineae bacterium]|nr:MAG: hypothetical protein F9K27_14580 [Anaerolineae bacterium]